MLAAAGWAVQDARAVNLAAARGVAVREFVMKPPHGRADYLLFVDRRRGRGHRGEEGGRDAHAASSGRRAKYVDGAPGRARAGDRGRAAVRLRVDRRRDALHERARPRRREPRRSSRSTGPRRSPAGSSEVRAQPDRADAAPPAARRCRRSTDRPLAGAGRRRSANLERVAGREPAARADPDGDRRRARRSPRRTSPTGCSSTPARAGSCSWSTAQPRPPDAQGVPELRDARRRPQVHRALQRPAPHLEPRSTRSRAWRSRRSSGVYSMLRGEAELDDELDEHSAYELADRAGRRSTTTRRSRPRRSTSSSSTSATARSTACGARCSSTSTPSSIGLTATPGKQTFGFFDQNLVMEYGHAAGGRRRRQRRLRRLPHPHRDQRAGLDDRGRHVVTEVPRPADPRASAGRSSTRTSPTTRRPARPRGRRHATRSAPCSRRSATGSSPRSSPAAATVPKTLIFAKDDAHADDIVADRPRGVRQGQRLRRQDHLQGDRPEDRGADRRVPQHLQPADRRHRRHDRHRHRREAARVRLLHARRSRSRTYFEQMKGRGVRVIADADFQAVTPDADGEDRFVHRRRRRRHRDRARRDRRRSTASRPCRSRSCCRQVAFGVARPGRRLDDRRRGSPGSTGGSAATSATSSRRSPAEDASRRSRAASSRRSTPTGSSTPRARRPARDEPTVDDDRGGREGARSTRRSRRSRTNPELRERIVERPPAARAGDRRDLRATTLLEAGYSADADRPRARDRRVVGAVLRGAPRRDHRAPGPLRRAVRAAAHVPRGQGARRRDRAAAAPLDARAALGGVRGARPLEGARLGRARAHRPRLARPLRARTRTTSSSPTPSSCASASTPGCCQQENAGRAFTRRAARLARAHPRPRRRLARDLGRRLRLHAVRRGGRAREGGRRSSATTSAPLLDELNEVLVA